VSAAAAIAIEGERNGSSKLREVQVHAIKRDLKAGRRQVDIARDHKVSQGTVSHINRGYRWRGVLITSEVSGYVRSKYAQRRASEDYDDIQQEAALQALESRSRYGIDQFSYLTSVAFREVNLSAQRWGATVSISEKAATGDVKGDTSGVRHRGSLFKKSDDGVTTEERFQSNAAPPAFALRGELDRLQKVVELFRGLGKKEKRLILLAVVDAREESLRTLAIRSKLARPRAANVLKAFADAVGSDPSVEHLARVISRA
jgi:hypothetical protein